jgi:tetratricopeptide (TPR) repeat protein
MTIAGALVVLSSVAAVAQDPAARLNEALRLSSIGQYHPALAEFEAVRAQHPEAISSLLGLKMVTVYAQVGDTAKFLDLTRWMLERFRNPTAVTDAERQIKGYIVQRSATDPQLVAEAVQLTRYASEKAASQGEGDYQGFFDTSRGIALYRARQYQEAAAWLSKGINHESLYVRSLAQPFYAMTLRAQGNRARADQMLTMARHTAASLPASGTTEYSAEWTDILITKMVMRELEDVFKS